MECISEKRQFGYTTPMEMSQIKSHSLMKKVELPTSKSWMAKEIFFTIHPRREKKNDF